MRVIGGSAGGRRLKVPRGVHVRPTADRVKESLFNVLGQTGEGLRVLDLFAGSGALGIEALSRGASEAVFVERDFRCIPVIRQNLKSCGLEERANVIRAEVLRFLSRRRADQEFQIIFADPPYERGLARACLERVEVKGWLTPTGRMAVEHSRREEIPKRLNRMLLLDFRAYGDTRISIYGCAEQVDGVTSETRGALSLVRRTLNPERRT